MENKTNGCIVLYYYNVENQCIKHIEFFTLYYRVYEEFYH